MPAKMKNLYAFIVLLCASVVAQGQNAEMPDFKKGPYQSQFDKEAKQVAGGFTEWYNYGQEMYGFGGNVSYYRSQIWPDTTVFVDYSNGIGRPWIHSIGQVFDPRSDYFEVNHPAVSGAYSIDSIAIPYRYFRFQNGAPDTLVLQIFEHSRISIAQNPGFPNGASYATVAYNSVLNKGNNPNFEQKIVLTESDTAMGADRFLQKHLGLVVDSSEIIVVTCSYIPGNPYNAGDTIDGYLDPLPGNPRNSFVAYMFTDDDQNVEYAVYNHALVVNTPIRYNYSNGWNSRYLAGTAYPSSIYHMNINWLVSNPPLTVGLEEADDAFEAEVYPNPVTDILTVKLSSSQMLPFNIVNAMGQVVIEGSVSSGNSQIDLSGLEAGLYSIVVFNDGTTYSKKLNKL